ncbi:Gpi16 subunit GPI transamidase component family protein [Acanthocheilonema viteae]
MIMLSKCAQKKWICKHKKSLLIIILTYFLSAAAALLLLSLRMWIMYNGFIIFFAYLLIVSYGSVDLRTLKGKDTYAEELLIKRLKSGHLLAQFRFVITSDAKSGLDYVLFPRIISEVVTKHHIQEFHLSLTQGFWRLNEWGVQPQPSSPSGAQLYALISGNSTSKLVDERWSSFVNSMNGIFCTSLLDILPTYTAVPQLSFSHMGYVNPKGSSQIRYGALASETVCTENFTPWRKLLPCKQTGLSTLLNPIKMYESVFHSMSAHFLHVCEDGTTNCGTRRRLELSLNFVSGLDLKSRNLDWSFRHIFGRRIDQKCVVADRDIVLFEVDRKVMMENSEQRKIGDRIYSLYNISAYPHHTFPIDISAKYESRLELPIDNSPTLVTIRTYASGTDQQSGRLISILRNGQHIPQCVVYTHVVPWFIKIYYHTIRFTCHSLDIKQEQFLEAKVNKKVFVSAKDRQRPFLLEWNVTLPENSFCEISFEFDKAFLRVSEYPPDANHGFYIPAPVITFTAAAELWKRNRTDLGDSLTTTYDEILGAKSSRIITMHGEVLLVLLPVPDFSMPFNVICLVCTAIAMLFGPVHTLTTKMMIPLSEEDKDLAPLPPLRRLLLYIYEFIIRRLIPIFVRQSVVRKEKVS